MPAAAHPGPDQGLANVTNAVDAADTDLAIMGHPPLKLTAGDRVGRPSAHERLRVLPRSGAQFGAVEVGDANGTSATSIVSPSRTWVTWPTRS